MQRRDRCQSLLPLASCRCSSRALEKPPSSLRLFRYFTSAVRPASSTALLSLGIQFRSSSERTRRQLLLASGAFKRLILRSVFSLFRDPTRSLPSSLASALSLEDQVSRVELAEFRPGQCPTGHWRVLAGSYILSAERREPPLQLQRTYEITWNPRRPHLPGHLSPNRAVVFCGILIAPASSSGKIKMTRSK